MERLYFITGNKNKFREIKSIIPYIEQLEIDLSEIQESDAKNIIRAKLMEAFKHVTHKNAEFIVEDTSLYFDCLNGLPGPLIKWFLSALGNDGLYNIVTKLGNSNATATTIIGYAKSLTDIHFFEGSLKGNIVAPLVKSGFGWDSIFQPEGYSQSFAQMGQVEKDKISMRKIAATKLKEYLG